MKKLLMLPNFEKQAQIYDKFGSIFLTTWKEMEISSPIQEKKFQFNFGGFFPNLEYKTFKF